MPEDTNDPWAQLPEDEALRRISHTAGPRWQAWTVPTTSEGIIWCARRLADGALAHGDHPSRLLQHIADADDVLTCLQRGWP